nr:hypothetical protein [Microbacterium lemovicicum]
MTLPINGGIGLATTTDGQDMTPKNFFSDILSASAESAWATARPGVEHQLTDLLQQADLVSRGFTLYDVLVRLSSDLSIAVERTDQGDLLVTVTTGGNYVEATSTQPTAAGEWADPRVSVSFGLTFSYVLDVPPVTAPLSATGFRDVRVLDPVADSHNLIADIGFFLNDLVDFFGGPNLIQAVQSMVAAMDFAPLINQALAPLNAELTDLAAKGYWFLDVLVDLLDGSGTGLHGLSLPGAPSDRLDVLLVARAMDRSGVIEGEISWPRSLGRPVMRGMLSHTVDIVQATSAVLLTDTRAASAARIAETAPAERPADVPEPAPAPITSTPAPAHDEPLTTALENLAPADRVTAARDLRQGSASRFTALVGSTVMLQALREFASGRTDFTVEATTAVGGTGLIPNMESVSRLDALWAADDESTCRRRFRLAGVATVAPLTVTAAIASAYEWQGSAGEVVVVPSGWDGTVTVTTAPAAPRRIDLGERRVAVDATRVAVGAVLDRGVAALNPQPLPPVEVSLNPQPLPPADAPLSRLGDRIGARKAFGGLITQEIDAHRHIDVVAALLRHDPTGAGVVSGIDFTVTPYVPAVIR